MNKITLNISELKERNFKHFCINHYYKDYANKRYRIIIDKNYLFILNFTKRKSICITEDNELVSDLAFLLKYINK